MDKCTPVHTHLHGYTMACGSAVKKKWTIGACSDVYNSQNKYKVNWKYEEAKQKRAPAMGTCKQCKK